MTRLAILSALALSSCVLSSCATYSVTPFFDAGANKVICCKATATNSKNIATVNFSATEANGDFTVRFAETGVNAAAPIAAAAIAASDVSAAVTSTAISAAQILK